MTGAIAYLLAAASQPTASLPWPYLVGGIAVLLAAVITIPALRQRSAKDALDLVTAERDVYQSTLENERARHLEEIDRKDKAHAAEVAELRGRLATLTGPWAMIIAAELIRIFEDRELIPREE